MWNKFKEGFKEGWQSVNFTQTIIDVSIAVIVVYILAWLVGEPADDAVGWIALGIAATRQR